MTARDANLIDRAPARDRWRLATLLVLAAMLLIAPETAGAQGTAPARLTGVVVDTGGRTVRDALIATGTGGEARSDARGTFVLTAVVFPATVTVRAVGFQPRTLSVTSAAESPLRVVLLRGTALDTVRVVDRSGCDETALSGFDCRRRAGVGHFRTGSEIRALRPQLWADMLAELPGLRRRPTTGPYGYDARMVPPPSQCLVELWNGQPPMKTDGMPFQPDSYWLPSDVIGIEYYEAYRDVPLNYRRWAWPADSRIPCKLIVYWLNGATRGKADPRIAARVDSLRRASASARFADSAGRQQTGLVDENAPLEPSTEARQRAVAAAIAMRVDWLGDLSPVDECSVQRVLGAPFARSLLPRRLQHLVLASPSGCTNAPPGSATVVALDIDPVLDCPNDRAFVVTFRATDSSAVRVQRVRVNGRRAGIDESEGEIMPLPRLRSASTADSLPLAIACTELRARTP